MSLDRPAWVDETLDELREVRRLRSASRHAKAEAEKAHGMLSAHDGGLASAAARANDAREQEARRWQEQIGVLRTELDYIRGERLELRSRLDDVADVKRERDVAHERESSAQQRIDQLEAEAGSARMHLEQVTATADGSALELAGLRPRLKALAEAKREVGIAEERERLAVHRIGLLEAEAVRRQGQFDASESTAARHASEAAELRKQFLAKAALATELTGELEKVTSRLASVETDYEAQRRLTASQTARAADAEARVLELETQVDDLVAEAAARRVALWAMSRDLERHRASAAAAQMKIAGNEPSMPPASALSPAQSGPSAAESLLAVARHERDRLEGALRAVVKEKQQAAGELAMVRASRGYRWTRWLAPSRDHADASARASHGLEDLG